VSAAALVGKTVVSGIRPVNLRTDLAGIADLIELCFGPTMTEAGRAAVREMRMISQSGWLTLFLVGADRVLGGLEEGFVWIEQGQIVGNVSLSPANFPLSEGSGYLVANVAVHPDFRRRGLAQSLVLAALELVHQKGGNFAVLQVEAANEVAYRLYTRLGFRAERGFVQWIHPAHMRTPPRLESMPNITLRQPNEWRSEFALAELVRPNSQGGLGWLRPTTADAFRPSMVHSLVNFALARSETKWIVRQENAQNDAIIASLHAKKGFGGMQQLVLLVHPSQQGKLEEPLINFVLRDVDGQFAVSIEHPTDDVEASRVLERNLFRRQATFIHMRYDF
jgi:GNAT superfamily N-acetyltransferase